VLRYWGNYGCFLDSTQEDRRAMRVATDVPYKKRRSERWRDWYVWTDMQRGGGEMIHGGMETS
jgi:hypothetical protein